MFGNEYVTRDSMDSFDSKSTSFAHSIPVFETRHPPAPPSAILSFVSSFEGDVPTLLLLSLLGDLMLVVVQKVQIVFEYCWVQVRRNFEALIIQLPRMRTRHLAHRSLRLVRPFLANGGSTPSVGSAASASASSSTNTRLYHGSTTPLSSAGRSSICAPRASLAVDLLPSYLADARAVQKYSPETPDGALQLSVAENQMLEDMLVPSLKEMYATQDFPADAIYYQPTQGRPGTRIAMANYLQDLLGLTKPIDADGIVIGAGCNAVLENLCICLAEPGEGVMIPTPYYAAFEFDLVARAGTFVSFLFQFVSVRYYIISKYIYIYYDTVLTVGLGLAWPLFSTTKLLTIPVPS
jgi:hypothetical protein